MSDSVPDGMTKRRKKRCREIRGGGELREKEREIEGGGGVEREGKRDMGGGS